MEEEGEEHTVCRGGQWGLGSGAIGPGLRHFCVSPLSQKTLVLPTRRSVNGTVVGGGVPDASASLEAAVISSAAVGRYVEVIASTVGRMDEASSLRRAAAACGRMHE